MNDPQPVDATHPHGSTDPRANAASLNAFRHEITGQLIVFAPGEQQAYEKHCKMVLDHLLPVGDFERDTAQSIADDRWRLKRARSIEASLFALGMAEQNAADTGQPDVDDALAQARTWRRDAHNLHLLTVYEQRIQRAMDKNTTCLKALQTERKEAAKQAMHHAKLLLTLAKAQGEPYQPEAYFVTAPETRESVFSTSEIVQEMHRDRLLEDARIYGNSGKLPKKQEPKKPVEASAS